MALERGTFSFGAAVYPLTASTVNALVRDADPAIDYAGEYFEAGLEAYIGARIRAQSQLVGLALPRAVMLRLHIEPTPFLLSDQFKFPIFALWRDRDVWDEHTVEFDKSRSRWSFAYVLPPLTPVQAAALQPILRSVSATLRYLARQGTDPNYNGGVEVFGSGPAGIMRCRLGECSYGGFERINGELSQYYRALTGSFETLERESPVAGAYEALTDALVSVDLSDPATQTTVADFVQIDPSTVAPTVTLVTPSSGSYLGGTALTVRGTGFEVGTTPAVTIGGVDAANVVVVDDTTITCTSGAHDVYGASLIADVVVTSVDGLAGTLPAVFTYTNP